MEQPARPCEGRHLNRATSSKPSFSYNRITDKLCGSPAWKHTFTRGYTSSVGVQHGHNRIYKLCGSTAWKHTFTLDIQAAVGVQHGNTHSHKRIYTSAEIWP